MAQPTIDEACVALAAAIDGISGLRSKGFADDITNPPEAQVYTREYDPRFVFSGAKRTFALGVRVYVKRTDIRSAQRTLRGFMEPSGSTSVSAKIEDEASWTGVTIDDVVVTNVGQPFEFTDQSGLVYWAVDFDVDVIW